MKHTLTLITVLSLTLPVAHAAETDARLHADGKGWRLDKATITDTKRPRVLLIGDSILNGQINPIIIEHNRLAAKVMAEMNAPVNDFYALLVNKRELARGDRFHWTAPAYDLLAKTVVESVLRELEKAKATVSGFKPTANIPTVPPTRKN